MAKKDIPELLPGMTLYKHKGFLLYRVLRHNKTKGVVEWQKMFSDTQEEPIAYEQLVNKIERNHIKILSIDETKIALKRQQENLKDARGRINKLLAKLDIKDTQFKQFRTHCQEFERSTLRSQTKK